MIIRQRIAMAVLALVSVLLPGALVVSRCQLRRQAASYNDLSGQYSALSVDNGGLQTRCAALEQTALDAQLRADSAERELEALRRSPEPTPTPVPTEQPSAGVTDQRDPENE
ncbi:MAG: hypothetical protein ACI4O7_01680 [Aristaeellaceae bacterium]